MSKSELSPEMIFESSDWLVLNKPAGWLTIPGRGEGRLETPVVSEWAEKKFGKVWVVHRLDVDTSGVLLMTKNEDAHRSANIWFEKHDVKKTYEFLAQGISPMPMFKCREPIEGRPSTTQFEVLIQYGQVFFGRAIPLTGRRHQIRIHLSKAGFPLLGDTQYGGPKLLHEMTFDRVALHARQLELPGGLKFEAPLPKDFDQWLKELSHVA